MPKSEKYWDKEYQKTKSLWGFRPNPILIHYQKLIPKGKVLDLGIGEGRNALAMAERGFEVDGFDISETAIQRCQKQAEEANLKLNVKIADISNIDIQENSYSLIIAAMVFQFLNKPDIDAIIEKAKKGLQKGGTFYMSAFSTENPSYKMMQENNDRFELVSPNTFYSKKKNMYLHHFSKEEVLSYFTEFQIISYSESYHLDLGHGEPHYHGIIEYFGKKK